MAHTGRILVEVRLVRSDHMPNAISPTNTNPPKKMWGVTVLWGLVPGSEGRPLNDLFLGNCYFAIFVQGLMFGVPRIYYVYSLRIVVLANFSGTEFAGMQNSRGQATSF